MQRTVDVWNRWIVSRRLVVHALCWLVPLGAFLSLGGCPPTASPGNDNAAADANDNASDGSNANATNANSSANTNENTGTANANDNGSANDNTNSGDGNANANEADNGNDNDGDDNSNDNGGDNANDNSSGSNLALTSPSITAGAAIPVQFTEDGANTSPALNWSGAPAGTQEFALIMDDPDAFDFDTFSHWIVYKIPAGLSGLPADIQKVGAPSTPAGILQGQNDFATVGYYGPAPPPDDAAHRYQFTLYALDTQLSSTADRTKAQLLADMQGHILAQITLEATYDR